MNPTTTTRGNFVLIVEDDADACAALISVLADRGYSSSGVRTLTAAKLVMSRVLPDVLVLDLALPDGEGELLLHQLRASTDPRVANVPVVVVSGRSNARELAPGADAVFTKPVRLEEVLEAIAAVKRRRSGDEPTRARS